MYPQELKFTTIFRKDETNIGDWYSSPEQYFYLPGETVDIWQLNHEYVPETENIIYGGGGLIGGMRPMGHVITNQKNANKRIYGWGIGEHIYISLDEQTQFHPPVDISYPFYVRKFDLLGIRDWYPNLYTALPQTRWVPCSSCMHKAFDEEYEVKHDIAFFTHKNFPMHVVHMLPKDTWDYPHMTNDGENTFEEVINFLGSADVIITNSFHGAYWATLLGKVVICFPWSTKFYGLKHAPIMCPAPDWKKALNDKEQKQYKGALEECRQANKDFHVELINHILNTPQTFSVET